MTHGMYCKYHPETSASWFCHRCDVPYCVSCIPSSEQADMPRCTLCRTHLEPMGISNTITPFWYKLGHFFAYPATPLLLIIAALVAVAALMFAPEVDATGMIRDISIVSVVISILISAFMTKLNFSIMAYSAQGNFESPTWNKLMSTENPWVFLQLLVIYFILLYAIYLLLGYSLVLAVALILFVVISAPAMSIILCIEQSIFSTLNPLRILFVISAIGFPYVLLFFLAVLFLICSSVAIGYLDGLSSTITIPVASFVSTYVLFAMYHMFGYVIYQYHFELGFSVQRQKIQKNISSHGRQTSHLVNDGENEAAQSNALVEAEVYVQEGRYEDAEQVLTDAVKSGQTDDEVFDRLYKLLKLQDKSKLILKLTDKHLSLLHKQRSANKMRSAYVNALLSDPDYRPENPEIMAILVKVLNRKDELKHALELWKYLKKHHVDYPDLASVSFSLAKNITEKLNARKEAKQIIQWALNLATGELKETMKSYMDLLD